MKVKFVEIAFDYNGESWLVVLSASERGSGIVRNHNTEDQWVSLMNATHDEVYAYLAEHGISVDNDEELPSLEECKGIFGSH